MKVESKTRNTNANRENEKEIEDIWENSNSQVRGIAVRIAQADLTWTPNVEMHRQPDQQHDDKFKTLGVDDQALFLIYKKMISRCSRCTMSGV
jgi:hypothetical protein